MKAHVYTTGFIDNSEITPLKLIPDPPNFRNSTSTIATASTLNTNAAAALRLPIQANQMQFFFCVHRPAWLAEFITVLNTSMYSKSRSGSADLHAFSLFFFFASVIKRKIGVLQINLNQLTFYWQMFLGFFISVLTKIHATLVLQGLSDKSGKFL